jgi:hypothetical protein
MLWPNSSRRYVYTSVTRIPRRNDAGDVAQAHQKPRSANVDLSIGEQPLAKPWSCVFVARSGGRAQVLFVTEAEAKQFAERQARAFLGTREPLT